jgi:hypothetical protein
MPMADGRIPEGRGPAFLVDALGAHERTEIGRENHIAADRANHVARRAALIGHQIRGLFRCSIIGSRRIRWRHDPEALVESRVVPPATQHSGECRVAS